MEYYLAIKKNEILSFVTTWTDLEDIMLSEISQKEKDKYHMISYAETKEQNKQQHKIEIDSEMQRMNWWLPDGRVFGGSGEKVDRIKKYNLVSYKMHRDIKFGIGNTVNNIVKTMYGVRWVLNLLEDHFISYRNV